MRPGARRSSILSVSVLAAVLGGMAGRLGGTCGPFTDVAADAFCQFVLEIFTLGITTGTTPTTFDPSGSVTRQQMAAFLSRTVDSVLKRGSRRAALNRFWTARAPGAVQEITLGSTTGGPALVACDGADVWVANNAAGTLSRVQGSDGAILGTFTGAPGVYGVVSFAGRLFVTVNPSSPGTLYQFAPQFGFGSGYVIWNGYAGANPAQVAFDGTSVWTADIGGSVSHFNPATTTGATVTTGFLGPIGILYDGTNVWTTDFVAGKLFRLDANGAILQTVTVGSQPRFPVFDGTNIWVPNYVSNSVSVVRASTGAVVTTLTGNGLNGPVGSAFDGERTLVTNFTGDSLSLWKAADLTTIGTLALAAGSKPNGAASDGVNFWVALYGRGTLLRF